MLLYNEGKFCACGFAFAVPNGFFINTEPLECFPCGFGAWDPKANCYVEWEIESNCKGTLDELRELFAPGSGMFLISHISPIIINGLPGHHVSYSYKGGQRYEIRLSSGDGDELSFRVESRETDIVTAIHSQSIQEAIREIWPVPKERGG